MSTPAMSGDALDRYRVAVENDVRLTDDEARDRSGLPGAKDDIKAATAGDIAEIDRLQEILYAQAKHALLVVLQGMDASGKDGTIRKVFGPLNPLGAVATSFKEPTRHELAHDYLWRIHQAVPPRGVIGLLNRSHYEDVVAVRVRGLAPLQRIERRYDQINAFERHLVENDVTILKFYLHISKSEQKARLQARLEDPTKRWKFSPHDLAARKRWDDYIAAYRIALQRCSTDRAPWFIVPADRKWYRNAVIARLVRQTLEAMHLAYPSEMPGLDSLEID